MIKVRTNFFETNSSSTHAITLWGNIATEKKLHNVSVGEYGWENACYSSVYDKAAYIYTVFAYANDTEDFFEEMENLTGQTRDEMFLPASHSRYYYIDHNNYDLNKLLKNLDTIIFWDGVILTGNDNWNCWIEIPEGVEYIYKGN